MTLSDELRELEHLRATGTLSEDEFQQAKQNALNGGPPTLPANNRICGIQEDTWCMLMHLSQLLLFAGGIGIAVPIVMWAISKDESETARRHGARMMNWLLSSFILALVFGILCLVLIGIPLLIILLILDVVFPVMAAIKANDQTLWSYPMSFKLLDED